MTVNAESKEIIPAPLSVGKAMPWLFIFAWGAYYGATRIYREPHDAYAPTYLILSIALLGILVWRLIFQEDFLKAETLLLDSEGLRLGEKYYRWNDIDQFGVLNDYLTVAALINGPNQVYWTHRPASSARSGKVQPNDIQATAIYSSRYKLDATNLATVLNDWMQQHSDRTTTVHCGPKLQKQRFIQRLFLLSHFSALVIIALWIFLRVSH